MNIQRKQIVCVLVILVSTGVLILNRERIDSQQTRYAFNRAIDNPDIPPSLAVVTFAIGPMRGLLADILWFRAIQRQDQGEYFDALQLTTWITRLQPSFATIWAYHGWNMAYNIAHNFAEPEDRWEWIMRSIKLLRDEGLAYNPDNQIIRQELARLFYQRIPGPADPGAEYFKNQWAFTVMRYLKRGDRSELEQLRDAAETVEELRRRPGVETYLARAEAAGSDPLDFDAAAPVPTGIEIAMDPELRAKAALEIYLFYRRARLEAELNLDIDRMIKIDFEYGPFDWRLHQAHAVYWAAEDNFADFLKGDVNYLHVVRQSMVQSFYEGKLVYDPSRNVITRTNNLDIITNLHNFYEATIENVEDSDFAHATHRDFLEQAVVILHTYNRMEDAHELFEHYRETYVPNDQKIDYSTFVIERIEKTLGADTHRDRRSVIEAALFQSFFWLDLGDDDRSNGYYRLAHTMYQTHQRKYQNNPSRLLPPMEGIIKTARDRFVLTVNADAETLKKRREEAALRPPPPRLDLGGHP